VGFWCVIVWALCGVVCVFVWCVGSIGFGVWGYVSEVLFYTCSGLALVPFGRCFMLFWWRLVGLFWCVFVKVRQ